MDIPFSKLLGQTVVSVAKLSGGINNPTYKLTSDSGRYYILQFAGEKFPNKTTRQPLITSLLKEKTSLPVANIIKSDSSGSIISDKYILTECLPGVELGNVSSKFTNNQVITLYKNIAQILSSLHKVRFASFGELVFNEKSIAIKPSFSSARNQIFEEYSSWINKGLNSPFAEFVPVLQDWLKLNVAVFSEDIVPCLTHNDFRNFNILVLDDGSISGIVDLDNIRSSNSVADIYRIYHNFSGEQKTLALKTFFEHYTIPLPHNFEKQLAFYEITHVLAYFDCWKQILDSYSKEELEKMTNKMTSDVKTLLATNL